MELFTEMTEWIGENRVKVAGWNKRDFIDIMRKRFRFLKTKPGNLETWKLYVPYTYYDFKRDGSRKIKS